MANMSFIVNVDLAKEILIVIGAFASPQYFKGLDKKQLPVKYFNIKVLDDL